MLQRFVSLSEDQKSESPDPQIAVCAASMQVASMSPWTPPLSPTQIALREKVSRSCRSEDSEAYSPFCKRPEERFRRWNGNLPIVYLFHRSSALKVPFRPFSVFKNGITYLMICLSLSTSALGRWFGRRGRCVDRDRSPSSWTPAKECLRLLPRQIAEQQGQTVDMGTWELRVSQRPKYV